MISYARLVLAVFSLLTCVVSEGGVSSASPVCNLLIAYVAVAVLLAFLPLAASGEPVGLHLIDLVFAAALLLQGTSGQYFPVAIFTLIAGSLRWGWRGSAGTAWALFLIVLLGYATASPSPDEQAEHLSRATQRGAFLVIAGAMLAYSAAFRERIKERLAKVAAWPALDPAQVEPLNLAPILRHAAELLRVRNILVVWEQREEPDWHVLVWTDNAIRYSKEQGVVLGKVIGRFKPRDTLQHRSAVPFPDGAAHFPELNRQFRNCYGNDGAL